MSYVSMREQMPAVLRGDLPQRVPFFPTIYIDHACVACDTTFEEAIINPALGQKCMLDAARRYETGIVRFCTGPEASWYDQKLVEWRDGKLVEILRDTGKIEGFYDVMGGGALIRHENPDPPRSVADVHAIEVPSAEEYRQRGYFRDSAPLVREAHDEGIFTVGMVSGQSLNYMVAQMGNPVDAILLFIDAPEMAFALIDKAIAISIEKCNAFLEAGVDCLFIGDSYASASVISPQIYKRFCAPAQRQMAEEFRPRGVPSITHCCGNYNPLLDALPRTGVDGMDGMDPTSGMTVAHTKQCIGDQMTLMGGLSCLNLLGGTPEQVYAEARQCVEAGKPGGRFILGSGCAVARYTPPQNVIAARQATLDFGVY